MTKNVSTEKISTTMAGSEKDDNKHDFQRSLDLFNDQALPQSLRSTCLALFAEREIRHNATPSSSIPSPNKKRFMAQVVDIKGLDNISDLQKNDIIGQLTQSYSETKTREGASIPVSKHRTKESTDSSGVIYPLVASNSSLSPTPRNAILGNQVSSHLSREKRTICHNWSTHPHVEHASLAEALSDLGPTILQIKKFVCKDNSVTEYECNHPECSSRMRVSGPKADISSGPAYVTRIGVCAHKLITWADHYRSMVEQEKGSQVKVICPRIGLHPLVKAHTNILAMTNHEPKEISRQIQIAFDQDPMFFQSRPVRDLITRQIHSRVRWIRKQHAKSHPSNKNIHIGYTQDVVTFKEKHLLRLPVDFQPQSIESETHLVEVARCLERSGHLVGKKHQPLSGFPHRDLIILEYNDVEDLTRYQHLDERREKEKAASNPNTREAVKANTVVFTSLSLLCNLCSAAKLGWEVCGSADGTHGLLSNDYKVIGFGILHVGTEGVKRFHPLAYALATGELELVALLLLHYLKRVARDLFGLAPRFKGGIISDHTEVFVNAFQEVFPHDQVLQCFPHIIRKFRIDGKREGNGQYMKLLKNNPTTWLRTDAEKDVYMLRGCRSQGMFDRMKDMILSSWRSAGEQQLADTFSASYLNNNLFNKWRYNASGIPGCIPQNNSHERSNLDTKGCASFAGIIKSGRNMSSMLNDEFPKLVYVNSIERTEVERNFPILYESKTLKDDLFEYYGNFNRMVDCVPYKDGFMVNKQSTLGIAIDVSRITAYEESLNGKFELEAADREVFYNRVNDLCFVTKKTLDSKMDSFYTGSCFHFYNRLSCHHAAVLQYADQLPTAAKKISQEKQGRHKRRKMGRERMAGISSSKSLATEALPIVMDSKKHTNLVTQPDDCPGSV
jgi:hypothetical protein